MNKLHCKKGDTVFILSGKDKGKRGKILEVFPKERKIIVEGVNIVKRHTRPTRDMRQGGIIQKPAPIFACKVMVVCPRCNKPTRIRRGVEENKRVRRCKRCGETIDVR